MTTWYLGDLEMSSAPYMEVVHEVGHMFGLKDEYKDPTSYPKKVEPSNKHSSLMYTTAGKGHVLKRHIEDIVFNRADVKSHLHCSPYEVKKR